MKRLDNLKLFPFLFFLISGPIGYAQVELTYLNSFNFIDDSIYTHDIDVKSVKIDPLGNTYVTGYLFGAADFDPTIIRQTLTSADNPLAFFAKYDNNGNCLFAKMIEGTDSEDPNALVLDDNGNIYVTGSFEGTADFDPGLGVQSYTSNGIYDIFLAKYDNNGNYVFAKRIGSNGYDDCYSMEIDDFNNIYITGFFSNTVDFDPGPGVSNKVSAGGRDIFFAKYSSSGDLIWVNQVGGGYDDYSRSIGIDEYNNVYISGSFYETLDFDPGPTVYNLTTTTTFNYDRFIAKYTESGDVIFANGFGNSTTEHESHLALDTNNFVYVTGDLYGSVDFDPSPSIYNLISSGGSDIFVVRYDSIGLLIDGKKIGSGLNDLCKQILLDTMGSLYMTGSFSGTVDFDLGPGTSNLVSISNTPDIFFARYDYDLNYKAAKKIGSNQDGDIGMSIALDSSKNIVIVGHFQNSADFDPGAGSQVLNTGYYNLTNGFVAKYDTVGLYIWANRIGGETKFWSNQEGKSIVTDTAGNVYVTGYFSGAVDFDSGPEDSLLATSGGNDIFFTKYDLNENFVFAKKIGSSGNDMGFSIEVDDTGNIYLAGQFTGTADFDPGPGIYNLTSLGSNDAFLAKYDVNGNLIYANKFGGAGDDQAYQVMISDSGYVYLIGTFQNTVDFDPGAGTSNLTSPGSYEIFFSKYYPGGNFIYAKNVGSVGEDRPTGIKEGENHNIYITGFFCGVADFDPGPGTVFLSANAGSPDIFLAKYSSSGNYVFAIKMGSTASDKGLSLDIDSAGYIYVTGHFSGTVDFNPGAGVSNRTSAGWYDIFLAKYSINGIYIWAKAMGSTSFEEGNSIAFNNNGGRLYLTGYFYGNVDFDPNAGIHNLSSINAVADIFLAEYDLSGNYVDAKKMGGAGPDVADHIAINNLDHIYVTGFFQTFSDFDPGVAVHNLYSLGGMDVFVGKYNKCVPSDMPVISSFSLGLCPLDSTLLTITSGALGGAADWKWYESSCGGTQIGFGDSIVVFPTSLTTYYARAEGGCIAFGPCGQIVVGDILAPVPDQTNLPNAVSECLVSLTSPTATDNCSGTIVATTTDPMVFSSQGTYQVVWTYNDGNGNTTTQTQNITVDDNIAPIPDISSLPDITGSCSVVINTIPSATDNCLGSIFGVTPDPLTYGPGSYVLTWTYSDGNGNSFSQTQNVVVDDNSFPTPDVPLLADLMGNCMVTVSLYPTATDNCAGSITGVTLDPLLYTSAGIYTLVWNYTDNNGNTSTQTQNVIVNDILYPIPDITSLPDLIGNCGVIISSFPTATDNCTGTVNGSTADPLIYTTQGMFTVVWSYTDGNGNTSTQTQNVIVDDNIIPTPDLVTLPDLVGNCGIVISSFPTATDNCAGSISGTTTDPLIYSVQGTFVVVWNYTDGNGNSSTQTQNVIVDDNAAPVPDVLILPDLIGNCSVTVGTYPTATDICTGVVNGVTTDPLMYSNQGIFTIIWSYTDGNGNTSTQTQNVVVDDSLAPIPDITSLPDLTGICGITISSFPTAMDSCVGIVNGTTTDPLSYTTQGMFTVVWSYTDGNGNSSTQTQNIIVDDNVSPVADTSILSDISATCTVTISNIPTATDNCIGLINGTTLDPLTYGPGSYIVTWTYDDGNNNISTQTQSITVDPCLYVENSEEFPQIVIYPNPSEGSFVLSFNHGWDGTMKIVKLYNAIGQLLFTYNILEPVNYFTLNNLAAGSYYLQVSYGSHIAVKKVILK